MTILYFAGGYAFNRFYRWARSADGEKVDWPDDCVWWWSRKAEGIENQIPQYDFWVSLPGLVKDGCVYTYKKVYALVRRDEY